MFCFFQFAPSYFSINEKSVSYNEKTSYIIWIVSFGLLTVDETALLHRQIWARITLVAMVNLTGSPALGWVTQASHGVWIGCVRCELDFSLGLLIFELTHEWNTFSQFPHRKPRRSWLCTRTVNENLSHPRFGDPISDTAKGGQWRENHLLTMQTFSWVFGYWYIHDPHLPKFFVFHFPQDNWILICWSGMSLYS